MTVAQQIEKAMPYTALSRHSGKELKLAMQRLWLTGRVTPFGGRLLVEHTFESAESEPVEAIYAFMLPQDAALRSFRVTGEGFEIDSDLQPVKEAVETYEDGIDDGSLSVLARQYADGMMNLTVGNLQPGETVRVILEILAGVERHDDGFRFRFPFTLAPAYHARARAVPLPRGGEMELPHEEFGDLILPIWRKDPRNLHGVGFDLHLVGGQEVAEVGSPSHALTISGTGHERRVGLAVAAEVPDRDLVLEAKAAAPWNLAWSWQGEISALIGSSCFGEVDEASPRRVVFVIDRSGSMAGGPIEQAKRAVEAGIAAMRPQDRFSIVAFDNTAESISKGLLEATDTNRDRARRFLASFNSGGGTELALGVERAASVLDESGGDLLLLTDGQVFGTAGILETARRTRARIHTLGIGSASQDRFLAQIGRDTGGRSRFLTPRERVDLAMLDLFAGVSPAIATDVQVASGSAVLSKTDVFPGQPLLWRGEGGSDELEAGWQGGTLRLPVVETAADLGETLRLLEGAARITALESRIAGKLEGKQARSLEELSRTYGLASRAMALVAVVKRASDQPGQPPQTQVVPVGIPRDLEMAAYFAAGQIQAAGVGSPALLLSMQRYTLGGIADAESLQLELAESWMPKRSAHEPVKRSLFGRFRSRQSRKPDESSALEDDLVADVSRLETDGGMPGETLEERITISLELLERLIDSGSTRARGPFRHHVRRLLEFLEKQELYEEQIERLAELTARAELQER